jgi:hypothetical protein
VIHDFISKRAGSVPLSVAVFMPLRGRAQPAPKVFAHFDYAASWSMSRMSAVLILLRMVAVLSERPVTRFTWGPRHRILGAGPLVNCLCDLLALERVRNVADLPLPVAEAANERDPISGRQRTEMGPAGVTRHRRLGGPRPDVG